MAVLGAQRLLVIVLVVLCVSLTLRSRGVMLSARKQAPATVAAHSFMTEAAALRAARLRASSASIPPPPPPAAAAATNPDGTIPPQIDYYARNIGNKKNGKPHGSDQAAREWATQHGLGEGWKRTLPADIAASATWFEHERTLPQLFKDVGVGEIVWLTFANSAFKEFTINWAAHVYKLRKERNAAIAALDKPLQDALRKEGLPYFGYDYGKLNDLRSDVVEFRRLGALKGELVLHILRAERHVLLSDTDVCWLADPTKLLQPLALKADVMSATDCLHVTGDEAKFPKKGQGVNRCAYNPGNNHGHAAFNTGVVYLRATTAAKAFAAAWRSRLLSVKRDAWLDDQLAFNELIWHGYRNHPDGEVRAADADGKVITVRMMARKGEFEGRMRRTKEEDDLNGLLPDRKGPPDWYAGWNDLMRNKSNAFTTWDDTLLLPTEFTFAPLPARHFCSGHLFWEQQGMERRDCASVHTTFVEGGNLGKLWRMREAALWMLDPQSHYEEEVNKGEEPRRYITYEPPQPPTDHAPTRNHSHSDKFTDKYKAGWLVPDALNLSPRLRQHLELVRRHILALRDAMAFAFATNRILVLPRLPCLCDRSEGPLVLRECIYEASELPMPFICPLTHLFDIFRFQSIRNRPSHIGRIDFRESSFLTNPLTPKSVREGQMTVHILPNAKAVREAAVAFKQQNKQPEVDGAPPARFISLLNGSSDAQAAAALGAHADVPVLRLASAEGVFGGWTSDRQHQLFEAVVGHSSILQGSWCCSSWYKPSGSINYATPPLTRTLPEGCGAERRMPDDEGSVGGGAPPDAPSELKSACSTAQMKRLLSQSPFELVYAPALGKEGQDGYWMLNSGPTGGELLEKEPGVFVRP